MPLFSILTPVFNPPVGALVACLESVFAQTMTDWELCLADDGSSDPKVIKTLEDASRRDDRVRLVRLEKNSGIAGASNHALQQASGDFVALLDHDDLLVPHALEVVATHIHRVPDVDYLYSDEDTIDADGNHLVEFRKPVWSPARLRSQNYCCHLSVLRRELVLQLGGFRAGFDGSQDHDLVLRVSEAARRVVHISHVLYSWRAIPGSSASGAAAKPYAREAGRRAVQEHCDRVGITASVEHVPGYPGIYALRRRLTKTPLVSIIIPTKGGRRVIWGGPTTLVLNSVNSVLARSAYERLEIVVVADDDTPSYVLDRLHRLGGERLRVIPYENPFDFAEKINIGVASSHGEICVLLNDDTEVISPDWLETLVGVLQEPDVGMVGPELLLADGRRQSAGHIHGCGGDHRGACHLGRHTPSRDAGPFGLFVLERECSGVTAACAALRRSTFEEVGGMSPLFPHSFNDVDLSMKLMARGYRVIWTPLAKLYHFESLSRDPSVRLEESEALDRRWGRFLDDDDFVRFDARRASDLPAKASAP